MTNRRSRQYRNVKGPLPVYSCPAVLTVLAQKSGFFWMAQGLSATPL